MKSGKIGGMVTEKSGKLALNFVVATLIGTQGSAPVRYTGRTHSRVLLSSVQSEMGKCYADL